MNWFVPLVSLYVFCTAVTFLMQDFFLGIIFGLGSLMLGTFAVEKEQEDNWDRCGAL